MVLGVMCLLCWLGGLPCLAYSLLWRHRGEIVVPDGVQMVPVILYKDALSFIHVAKFEIIPALGCGYVLTALGLTIFLCLDYGRQRRGANAHREG